MHDRVLEGSKQVHVHIVLEIRQFSNVYTCWLAASLETAKSGHIFNSKKRDDDTRITDPVINPRCHDSRTTAQKQDFVFVI